MSPIGSLLLSLYAPLAAGTAWLGPAEPPNVPAELEGSLDEEVGPNEEAGPDASVEAPSPEEPPTTASDALVHLDRAQALVAAGDLISAEAEVSVAISLAPDDAAAYLERAQIRVALAEQAGREDASQRRVHAELLRLAAADVSAHLEHAALERESVAWFEARRDALLREADALDPRAVPTGAEPDPMMPVDPPPPPHDRDPGRRSAALLSVGALTGATAVGLATASVQIEQRCPPDGLCTADWRSRPSLLAPAIVLAGAGTTAVVLALAKAPGLERRHVRASVIGSTVALGSAAVVFGVITGTLAASRWGSVSPSNDAALGAIQALGNTSVASFTAALPLLSAGITAWVRGRMESRSSRSTTARGRSPRPRTMALDSAPRPQPMNATTTRPR